MSVCVVEAYEVWEWFVRKGSCEYYRDCSNNLELLTDNQLLTHTHTPTHAISLALNCFFN